jgi:hypothetical protein
MREFQANPEIAASLAYRIETVTDDQGKDHIELVTNEVPDDPAERTTAAMLLPLTRLRRPKERAGHGGARDACPKCSSPMTRTTYDICQNAECGHMVTHPSKTVGRPFHDETEAPPVQIGGDLYAVEVQGERPFHDEIKGLRTIDKQDETVSSRPVSFVSVTDLEWADDPHYWGESAPEPPPDLPAWQPPPIAPRSHLAWSPRRHRPVQAVAGGDE